MNCPKCQTENEANVQFCRRCGWNMHMEISTEKPNNRDMLLAVFLVIAFVSTFFQFLMQQFVSDWHEAPMKYVQGAFWLLQNVSFLLVALAIKNKSLRTLAIAVATILVCYWVYLNLQFLLM